MLITDANRDNTVLRAVVHCYRYVCTINRTLGCAVYMVFKRKHRRSMMKLYLVCSVKCLDIYLYALSFTTRCVCHYYNIFYTLLYI
jgi:hypothetical protein